MARKQDKNRDQVVITDETEGNVDQIRQILFGGQMRDYEKRFAEMETRLGNTIEQLGKNLEKRVDRLDAYTKREIEKLGEQLKAERKKRSEENRAATKDLNHFVKQVETWFAEVEDKMETDARDLRSDLKKQGDELLDVVRTTSAEMSASLQGEARDLNEAKLGREDLAALLSEVALRLKKDFKLPGDK